jgi:hypothetical protein
MCSRLAFQVEPTTLPPNGDRIFDSISLFNPVTRQQESRLEMDLYLKNSS